MSFSSKLKAFFGISQPVDQAHTLPRASLEAGSLRGSLKNWVPQQTHLRSQQAFERDLAIARVDDLYCDEKICECHGRRGYLRNRQDKDHGIGIRSRGGL